MTTLTELRTHRAEAESLFVKAMDDIDEALPGQCLDSLIVEALSYHREVCASYAAELSLISSGTLPKTDTGRGCAACDRGDYQLGHAEWCPKAQD